MNTTQKGRTDRVLNEPVVPSAAAAAAAAADDAESRLKERGLFDDYILNNTYGFFSFLFFYFLGLLSAGEFWLMFE